MILSQSIAPGATVEGLAPEDLRAVAGSVPAARVALMVRDPLILIRGLCALDGRVGAMLLLSHALPAETAVALAEQAGCSRILTDADIARLPSGPASAPEVETEWLMTTSGTTGMPKIVPHTLASLARSVRPHPDAVWGLIYDPTRFAGLQVVLQALIGGGRLVVAQGSPAQQVAALAGCTHLSATPTWWRRVLMLPERPQGLRQITLGGEIADQPTLSALAAAFPDARLTHIYASTEAGVGFSVKDGREGFPADYLTGDIRIEGGVLWLHGIDSGDRVERDGDRVRFLGRENGMMNIGGVKVYPEAVESVLLSVPDVVMAKVSAKRSPVTGALVMAEVKLAEGADPDAARARIQTASRAALVREAVPAIIRFVEEFHVNAAGKIVRS